MARMRSSLSRAQTPGVDTRRLGIGEPETRAGLEVWRACLPPPCSPGKLVWAEIMNQPPGALPFKSLQVRLAKMQRRRVHSAAAVRRNFIRVCFGGANAFQRKDRLERPAACPRSGPTSDDGRGGRCAACPSNDAQPPHLRARGTSSNTPVRPHRRSIHCQRPAAWSWCAAPRRWNRQALRCTMISRTTRRTAGRSCVSR